MHNDVLRAESEALHNGLQVCVDRSLWHTVVEINGLGFGLPHDPRSSNGSMALCVHYSAYKTTLDSFCKIDINNARDNMVADGFAKCAYRVQERVICDKLSEVPGYIQKLMFVDRICIPYFCSKCK